MEIDQKILGNKKSAFILRVIFVLRKKYLNAKKRPKFYRDVINHEFYCLDATIN